ncbi:SDR family oxidoreductase [Brevibacterium marinum]|uniref:NAD(P)-dependent dehydrogenase (Short-subunit alcohol dehydrogenase family) n=1 Tax=Brevibacterium marinum TaxID=418643 RepID=A0A846S9V7_9MICO|nr:SDR family oxidoreductase [Brevibacterium marinum]NJC58092.1 NAD(P)-dependent dehydrogenase (short-subunit alcohol dehydrogenase family) [Brevibacterium marinum]
MTTADFAGRRAIVTGAAGGIGAALAAELISRGAAVVLADLSPSVTDTASALNADAADGRNVAAGLDSGATPDSRAHAWVGDVSSVADIDDLIAFADEAIDGVDMYFANAGIIGPGDLGDSDADWDTIIDVNLRAHIRAAQVLIPRWQEAGDGYFVATASAAGLLTQIGSAAYSVTKHASVGFAEWLALTYRDDGIRASVICPMGVDTDLLRAAGTSGTAQRAVTDAGQVLSPGDVATIALDAVQAGEFLILPHPEVLDMYRMKGSDYDRWLAGMSRYQARLNEQNRANEETTHAGND